MTYNFLVLLLIIDSWKQLVGKNSDYILVLYNVNNMSKQTCTRRGKTCFDRKSLRALTGTGNARNLRALTGKGRARILRALTKKEAKPCFKIEQ